MAKIIQVSQHRYIDVSTGATYTKHIYGKDEKVYWVIKFIGRDAEEVRDEYVNIIEDFVESEQYRPYWAR